MASRLLRRENGGAAVGAGGKQEEALSWQAWSLVGGLQERCQHRLRLRFDANQCRSSAEEDLKGEVLEDVLV